MTIRRRTIIAMSVVAASCAASTRIVGAQGLRSADEQRAQQILNGLPQHSYYEIMLRLAEISTKGSTGENFNARWRSARNPLIAKLFQDVGYSDPVYDNCAPWCAVALAWCLQRDGRPLPSNPVASQSYLHYGTPVETPRLGDICIFTDVEDASIGHVGLFVGFAGADKVTVLGGNQKGDVDTRCGPGFLNSYITFEDVEINRSRRLTDNGLYLRQIRRPPERTDTMIASRGAGVEANGSGPAPATPVRASSPAARGALRAPNDIRLADFSRLLPTPADVASSLKAAQALPPIVGQTATGLLVGALGWATYRSAGRERAAISALSEQAELHALRQLEMARKIAHPTSGPPVAQGGGAYLEEVKAFALLIATAFKQVPISKVRSSTTPDEIRRRLEALEATAPGNPAAILALLRVKLAIVRLLNHIARQSRRTLAYRALFDGEVTPALRELLDVLQVELSPEEHRLVIETPVYTRPRWLRALTPKRQKIVTAPQLA